MTQRPDINQLSADQLRALATELMDSLDAKDQALGRKERELVRRNAIIEKLTHEVAILKHHKFARRSEQLDAVQGKLLNELIDSDLAAIEAELDQAMTEEQKAARPKQKPKRTPLPQELPRTLIHHEPDNTRCQCGCQLKRIVLAKTLARSWITSRASSRWSATSGASGPATSARPWSRHRYHRR